MKYEYDRETDTLTIRLSDNAPDHAEQTENVITHHSRAGKPVEIEILDASHTIQILSRLVQERGRTEA
jgi:uncharacterized protein YuzE